MCVVHETISDNAGVSDSDVEEEYTQLLREVSFEEQTPPTSITSRNDLISENMKTTICESHKEDHQETEVDIEQENELGELMIQQLHLTENANQPLETNSTSSNVQMSTQLKSQPQSQPSSQQREEAHSQLQRVTPLS